MPRIILIVIAVAACAGGFFWRRSAISAINRAETPAKSQRRAKTLATVLCVIGIYLLAVEIVSLIFGPSEAGFTVSLWAERTTLLGMSVSMTVIYTWIVMAILLIIAVIFRLTVIRRMKEPVKGAQNALELIIETINKYTNTQAHGAGEVLASYILTISVFLVACAFLELFGVRGPTADITLTFSLAIMTFFLINWYGIKKKGVGGRLKALASPTPVVFIIRVITDIAVPVSLASRLFGNMFGGMIVMDLLYSALGNASVGIPSVVGLYFNVFHPLIQAFIFVTLTLTFINEAIE